MLFVVRHSPYGSTLSRTALDAALASAAFEQPLKVLFMGEGVLQLMPGQETTTRGVRNIGKLLASLPLYDIESVYVDEASLKRYGMDPAASPVPAQVVGAELIRQMMVDADHILGF